MAFHSVIDSRVSRGRETRRRDSGVGSIGSNGDANVLCVIMLRAMTEPEDERSHATRGPFQEGRERTELVRTGKMDMERVDTQEKTSQRSFLCPREDSSLIHECMDRKG